MTVAKKCKRSRKLVAEVLHQVGQPVGDQEPHFLVCCRKEPDHTSGHTARNDVITPLLRETPRLDFALGPALAKDGTAQDGRSRKRAVAFTNGSITSEPCFAEVGDVYVIVSV